MAKEVIRPTNVHTPSGYSHAFKVGNTIYTAGQVALDQDGNLVGRGDFARQVEQTLENLKRILEAAGATMADVVQMTMFLTNYDDLEKAGEVLGKYFQSPLAPATGVQISRLARSELMIEINAIAVVD